jgi:hypothetical protein
MLNPGRRRINSVPHRRRSPQRSRAREDTVPRSCMERCLGVRNELRHSIYDGRYPLWCRVGFRKCFRRRLVVDILLPA